MSQNKDKQQEKPHYHGHRARARERFLKDGGEGLEDYEILEIFLFGAFPRRDTKPIAKRMLQKFGSIGNIMAAEPKELIAIDHVSESAVTQLRVAKQLTARALKAELCNKPVLQSWVSLLDYLRLQMGSNKNEQFRVLYLDSANKLIEDKVHSEGTVNQTTAYPREIALNAVERGSTAIIIVHNHPSGDCSPSRADKMLTQRIQMACTAVEVAVHDHVIISNSDHFSFASHGLL